MARRQVKVAVIDSSVAVKWFRREDRSNDALAMLDRHIEGTLALLATELLYYEVANALRYKPDFDEAKHRHAVEQLLDLHLGVEPLGKPLLSQAGQIAYECGLTIYDAAPAALALLKGTVCITADREIQYARLKSKRYPVELL